MKNLLLFLALTALIVSSCPLSAQNASYLDTVYQSQNARYQEGGEETDPVTALKDEIYQSFQIDVVDDPQINKWPQQWLTVIKEVLAALPESFRSHTKIISLDPGFMPFELRYNGFDDRECELIIGYGAIMPSSVYLKKFQEAFSRLPNDSDKVARFKSILVRGMAYAFAEANPDIAKKWSSVYNAGDISTKVYGPGQDINMVVLLGKNPAMVDMAFSVALYCAAGSELRSKSSARYDFINTNLMGGETVSGWGSINLPDDDTNNGNNNNNNGNNGSVETPGSRPPPEIPDGDYLPIVTEVDVGTAAASIPSEQHNAPDELKNAIIETFQAMPKFFSTCTEAIVYLPTTDTEAAFSSEGYVFITQNSWFPAPYYELNPSDDDRKLRFKIILLNEMTKRFLFFHPEVSKKWEETFAPNQSLYETYKDICEGTYYYVANSPWLKDLNQERYDFIKNEIMAGKEFPL